MNWKIKAYAQKMIAIFPEKFSYKAYLHLQHNYGAIRMAANPMGGLSAGIDIYNHIKCNNINPLDKIFFEVGTGTVPLVPLSLFLLGCKKTISVDLNPYINDLMFKQCLRYMINNEKHIRNLFGEKVVNERLKTLIEHLISNEYSRKNILELCNIEYQSPMDARKTKLNDSSIDFFISKNVFEHIPKSELQDIIIEANRIVKPNGLFINHIDYIDHYSYSDKSINKINFLKYSDKQWNFYAGNKYAYTNRMRHSDFIDLFKILNHQIIEEQPETNNDILEKLNSNLIYLDKKFKDKSCQDLSIMSAWIISRHH